MSHGDEAILRDTQILVTGGTGSFAHAFIRRALDVGASRIVAFSRDELKQAQLKQTFKDSRMRFFIGDVRDPDRLDFAMKHIDIVVHAAAMKRIETCEENPYEAFSTNLIGSYNVAKAAIRAGVQKAILLSTDKAPAAHTAYGMSKAGAERVWLGSNVYSAGTATKFAATRYGNVIASRGSVVETFRAQIKAGQPLTITSPDMSRYWMTIGQAVDLVLTALANMRGGEVFIPKIPSASLLTLVNAIAPNATYTTTGLRPNERMHETLISSDESKTTHDAGGWYVIEPEQRSWADLPPLPYPKVPEGWSYRSDTNEMQFTVNGLRRLVA